MILLVELSALPIKGVVTTPTRNTNWKILYIYSLLFRRKRVTTCKMFLLVAIISIKSCKFSLHVHVYHRENTCSYELHKFIEFCGAFHTESPVSSSSL